MIYLFEGKVHFNNSITALKEETNEQKLGKAIATMIGQKQLVDSIKN